MGPYRGRSLRELHGHLDVLRRTHLRVKILVAMVAGIGVGIMLGSSTGWVNQATAQTLGRWIALPGHLFLALIQSVVIALVFSSIVTGLNASENTAALRRISVVIIPFFILTTVVACGIGMGCAFLFNPGAYIDHDLVVGALETREQIAEGVHDSPAMSVAHLPDIVVSLIPESFHSAALQRNMLQIVVFAILVGTALLVMPKERSQPLLQVLRGMQEVAMQIVAWAMQLAPYAVFGLLAQITISIGLEAIIGMSVYVGVVMLGLGLLLIVYMTLVWSIAHMTPWTFLGHVRDVLLLAFSTSSSAAVMPLSLKNADDRLRVQPAISHVVIPLGATVNMAGTALYRVTAAIFLSQVFQIDLTNGALVVLIATTVGASIGSPATPGVGIVILATILVGVGIPPGGIALIIRVDRILDMRRTAVNVTGDLVGCMIADTYLATSKDSELTQAAQEDSQGLRVEMELR